jgi:heme-degrading monooxygenase HmoA
MAVLMIAEVPNLTEELYAGMVGQLMPRMKEAKGFISHTGGPNPGGGWRVIEVWETEEDSQAWFDGEVRPNLPPEIKPNRSYHSLHTAFTR